MAIGSLAIHIQKNCGQTSNPKLPRSFSDSRLGLGFRVWGLGSGPGPKHPLASSGGRSAIRTDASKHWL